MQSVTWLHQFCMIISLQREFAKWFSGLSLETGGFRVFRQVTSRLWRLWLLHSPLLVTPDLSSCLSYFTLTCLVSQKVIMLITAALLSVCPELGWFTLSHPVSQLGHRAGEVALGTAWDLIYESWLSSRCHSLNYFTFLSLSSFDRGSLFH